MPLSVFRSLILPEHEQALARIPRRALLIEYDRTIIQNTRNAIQRSRELLEATKHQVLPPGRRG